MPENERFAIVYSPLKEYLHDVFVKVKVKVKARSLVIAPLT